MHRCWEVFEKINGYKDGSFFTPGYITEYMCHEIIRRAVVQKFNEAYKEWNSETIDEVTGKTSRHEVPYPDRNLGLASGSHKWKY